MAKIDEIAGEKHRRAIVVETALPRIHCPRRAKAEGKGGRDRKDAAEEALG